MSDGVDICQVLDTIAADRPTDVALSVDDESWTFSDLQTLSLKAASRLNSLGVRADQIVAIPMANSAEQIAFFFGAWRLGATPMPLSPKLPDAELKKVMAAADTDIVVKEGQDLSTQPLWSSSYRTALRRTVQTSGGSTGAPKVIVDTNPATVNTSSDHWAWKRGWTKGHAMFLPGPTFHSGPMNHMIEGLARGVHVIMMRKFDAAKAVALISKHRPHWALFVPTMMSRIIKLPREVLDKADLSSLKTVWHSAAACPPWLKQEWIDLLGPEAIWEIFGGSEGVSTTIISGTEWLAHRGSVGRASNGEIAIFGADGKPVPNGQIGEIYMRNLRAPRRFVVATPTKRRLFEDWESFGDLGWLDDDGYLFLADRRVDMINCGGQNIYPAEVEAAIQSFHGVADAVVFGQRDDDLGEIPCALVYAEGSEVNERDLLEYLATQIVRYKIPRRISFTNEPIRNDAGKVRRSELVVNTQG